MHTVISSLVPKCNLQPQILLLTLIWLSLHGKAELLLNNKPAATRYQKNGFSQHPSRICFKHRFRTIQTG